MQCHSFFALPLLTAVLLTATAARGGEDKANTYPRAVLAGSHLRLTVYLPDAERGFYRGTRFDPSGLIARAALDGRTVYGPFRTPHDPTQHDAVVGPAEEFDMAAPPGWDEAAPGEGFMKIAVGILRKPPAPPGGTGRKPPPDRYQFARTYEVLRAPDWEVTRGTGRIAFRHALAGPHGRAYDYTKRIVLADDRPGFTLDHRLTNTGSRPLDTRVYNHNFTVIDSEPVGPAYRITFPFEPRPKKAVGPVRFEGRRIVIPEVLKGQSVWAALEGDTFLPPQHAVTVLNTRTGTGVAIKGDRPVAEWRFYAERTAACPEPFVRLRLAPGETVTWRTEYTFFVTKTRDARPSGSGRREETLP